MFINMYHENGNLVASPRCGSSFEDAVQLLGLKLTMLLSGKFIVFLIIFAHDCRIPRLCCANTPLRTPPLVATVSAFPPLYVYLFDTLYSSDKWNKQYAKSFYHYYVI